MARRNGSAWFYSYLPHGMAGGATSALIPLFAYALGGGLAEVGIIAAATSIASVPGFMLWGALSDRLLRRKVFLLLGFIGTALSFVAMAASSDLSRFYLANLLLGFLGAASAPVGSVLVMETSERPRWPARLAALSRVGGAGWSAGLALGFGWLSGATPLFGEVQAMRTLFVLSAALSAFAGLLGFLWLVEPAVKVERRDVRLVDIHPRIERGRYLPNRLLFFVYPRGRLAREVQLPRPLKIYLGSVFLMFTGFTAFYGFFPIFLKEVYGLASPTIFVVYVASQIASTAAYGMAGRWVGVRGSRPMQVYASVSRAALFPAFFLAAFLPFPGSILFAIALVLHAGVGMFWAILNVAGVTLVSRLAPAEGRAEALGAYNATQGIGSIAGPLLGGFVAQASGYGAAFAATAGFILLGALLLAWNRVPEG